MASQEEIKEIRLGKIKLLKEARMEAYPAKVPRDFCLRDAKNNFSEYEKNKKEVSLAGRIMAIRGQGAIFFVVLYDGRGKFQAVFKKDTLEKSRRPEGVGTPTGASELFKLFKEAVDVGDFISVTGTFFTTDRGEQSILVSSWTMAAKSLLTLPEKWHGIQDEDEKLRKRYLDILFDPELKKLFELKSKFWDVTRNFLKSKEFLEIETPTLELTTGGAEANPFKTHHNDFDVDVYLRISVGELWQKRLMAAGFPKTFEIGRVWRNEGTSPEHLQEFTNMEFYWAYADYRDGMKLVQEMYQTIAKEVFGKTDFKIREHSFDFGGNWPVIEYVDEIEKQTGINIISATEKEMEKKIKELGITYDGKNRERFTDTLWKYCRKKISGPAFLVHHPKLVSPLSKESKDHPGTVERFQIIIAGSEVGNGFSELNDPVDQNERFVAQEKLLSSGDKEAMMMDKEFVEMLEYGMPPTCGFGFGERLFAFMAGRPLRETQLFPLMRPK